MGFSDFIVMLFVVLVSIWAKLSSAKRLCVLFFFFHLSSLLFLIHALIIGNIHSKIRNLWNFFFFFNLLKTKNDTQQKYICLNEFVRIKVANTETNWLMSNMNRPMSDYAWRFWTLNFIKLWHHLLRFHDKSNTNHLAGIHFRQHENPNFNHIYISINYYHKYQCLKSFFNLTPSVYRHFYATRIETCWWINPT